MKNPYAQLAIVSITIAAWLAAPAAEAHACGGTFCDVGPGAMSVDQYGENVIFVVDDATVEAHVQIQYDGDPERFAWILPVPAVPSVRVGSEAFFEQLLESTTPVFEAETLLSLCTVGSGCGVAQGGGSSEDEPPEVVDGPATRGHAVVGNYEYEILQGRSVDEIESWLHDNDYAPDELAPEILRAYVEEGHVFVAFKLRPGVSTDELHPVVVRYRGDQAAIPIRLTRIAAVDDMGIRAFFLGDERVVPANYRHVQLNQLQLTPDGGNYRDVVSQAVDEPGADGHAFVTEYAGPTDELELHGLVSPTWDGMQLAERGPRRLSARLRSQGLLSCPPPDEHDEPACTWEHPLARHIVERYLPPPDGVSADEFYACSDCFIDRFETGEDSLPLSWDVEASSMRSRPGSSLPPNAPTTTWPTTPC